jgi:hypothetical protein
VGWEGRSRECREGVGRSGIYGPEFVQVGKGGGDADYESFAPTWRFSYDDAKREKWLGLHSGVITASASISLGTARQIHALTESSR